MKEEDDIILIAPCIPCIDLTIESEEKKPNTVKDETPQPASEPTIEPSQSIESALMRTNYSTYGRLKKVCIDLYSKYKRVMQRQRSTELLLKKKIKLLNQKARPIHESIRTNTTHTANNILLNEAQDLENIMTPVETQLEINNETANLFTRLPTPPAMASNENSSFHCQSQLVSNQAWVMQKIKLIN